MKNVGLITIHRIYNYGSALQTYATVKTVNKLGYECTVIDYKYPNDYHFRNAPFHHRIQAKEVISIKNRIIRKLRRLAIHQQHEKLYSSFKKFLAEQLSFTESYASKEELFASAPFFDIYIAGSDQIWNSYYCHTDNTFLLGFAASSAVKLSYSASFGTNSIPQELKPYYYKHLSQFKAISVRERSGIDILNELGLTDKHPQCVVDPTLLLTAKEWNQIASPTHFSKKPYILCYILKYSFDPYPYITDLVDYLHKQTGYKVLFIGGYPVNVFHPHYTVLPHVSPEEFLALYRDAAFVVTSSFHGTAFAINYEKPFFSIINNEHTTDDRQLDLIRRLNLENQAITKGSPFPKKEFFKVDYSSPSKKLATLRKQSTNYLASALGEENDKHQSI